MYWLRNYFSQPSVHLRAITEVLTVFVFSLFPFVVTSFVRSSQSTDGNIAGVSDLFSKGQIYLLSYALFGTLFWLAFVRWDRPRHDARAVLGTMSVLLVIPVIGFLGVDPTFSTIVNQNVVKLGYWLYGAFLVLHYLLLFYSDIEPPELNTVFDRGVSEMAQRLEALRRGE